LCGRSKEVARVVSYSLLDEEDGCCNRSIHATKGIALSRFVSIAESGRFISSLVKNLIVIELLPEIVVLSNSTRA